MTTKMGVEAKFIYIKMVKKTQIKLPYVSVGMLIYHQKEKRLFLMFG